MPIRFTALHFLLGTQRPEDREEAIRRIRTAFDEAGAFGKAAELLDISDRQLRRYCRDLGMDLVKEADAKKALAELDKARALLAKRDIDGARTLAQQVLAQADLIDDVRCQAYAMLAHLDLLRGDEESARACLRGLFRVDPEYELPKTVPAAVRRLYADTLDSIAAQLTSRAEKMRRSGGNRPARG